MLTFTLTTMEHNTSLANHQTAALQQPLYSTNVLIMHSTTWLQNY